MANVISDETMEYVGILAKLELSEEEKAAAKKDTSWIQAEWSRCPMYFRCIMYSAKM